MLILGLPYTCLEHKKRARGAPCPVWISRSSSESTSRGSETSSIPPRTSSGIGLRRVPNSPHRI